jgi:four helix bundle protein
MKGLQGFETFQLALALVRIVRGLVEKIRRHDPKLADELRRATSSVALNTAEGSGRSGRSGPHHYDVAYGSKREVEAAILIAQAWGYVADAEAARALEVSDRLGAMLWRARGR